MAADPGSEAPHRRLPGWARRVLRALYWVAVLIVSLALVVGAILYLESRDPGQLRRDSGGTATTERPAN